MVFLPVYQCSMSSETPLAQSWCPIPPASFILAYICFVARPPCFPAATQVNAVRAALDRHSEQLDEALLSNAFAWIRKCTEDRFDTMVQLIQKVPATAQLNMCCWYPRSPDNEHLPLPAFALLIISPLRCASSGSPKSYYLPA